MYRRLNCELFFVFPGIPQPLRKTLPEDRRPETRKQAWEAYQNGRTSEAMSLWNSIGSVAYTEVLNLVFEILQRAGIDFMRAPFSAAAQASRSI